MDILTLVERYHEYYYAVVFAWTFLEGETVVIFSGVAAREGALSFPALVLAAWSGSFLGDQLYFLVGRRWGLRLVERFPRCREPVRRSLDLLSRFSTAFILSFRFIYGVRNLASFAMGMSGISWARFALLNFVAAGIWALSFAGIGYLAGSALKTVLGDVTHGITIGLLVIFVLMILALIRHARRA
jgi:membrane protein DedA with SNARE-associated domain